MKTYYLTDPGRVRDHNEDNVAVLKNESNEYLMIVADGMGGHRKGEVASELVITYFKEEYKKIDTLGDKMKAVSWINNKVQHINNDILKYANTHADSKGMGTTLVIAFITDEYLLFANIGDSSGYVFKNDLIHKVTKDHTLVNLLVDTGNITNEEARNHPKKNVLMKALGVNEDADIDIFAVDGPYNGILLCSDGLTTMLSDEQIEVVLSSDLEIEEKVEKLINKCNIRGGLDNITVALLLKESGELI